MYRKDVQAREGRQQRIVRRRGVESIQRIRHPDTLAALLDNFARSRNGTSVVILTESRPVAHRAENARG
jgi:hypothetical protein